jgi:short-subunit dehydrogenase
MKKSFKSQTVFIVGGSSGIGLATAKLFARSGAHIAIFARRRDQLEHACREITGQALSPEQRIDWHQLDVSIKSDVDQVMSAAVDHQGVPDILINSAGRSYPHRFSDISYAQLDETMKINFYGIWNATGFLVPLMKAKGGHIVNVSSIAGFVGVYGFTDYCASKFAIMGFSEALRSELKPWGIRVSVLCPPDTDTPGFEVENRTKPEETKAISAQAKLMQPDAVARALIKGIQKNKTVIIPGFDGKMTFWAKRLFPSLVEFIMDRIIRKVQK